MTLTKKMTLFGIVVSVVMLISISIKYILIVKINSDFDNYANKAVAGKILTLEISKSLNYISRCTRDIMLGNDYEKNIKKIEKNREIIRKNFDDLMEIAKGSPNEKQELENLAAAKKTTMAFINDGYNKMKSLANKERTPEVLANMYQQSKEMLPL